MTPMQEDARMLHKRMVGNLALAKKTIHRGPDSSSWTGSWPRQTSVRAVHERVQLCQDPQRQNLPSYEKVLVSVVSTTSYECTATRSCKRNELLRSTTRLGKGPLRGSSRDSRRTVRSNRHSAQASPGSVTESAGHCESSPPWEHSLQPECQNLNVPAPLLEMMTAKIWIFLRPLGRGNSVQRSSMRSFHGCLIGLDLCASEEHTPPKAPSATSYEDRRLTFFACLPQMAPSLTGCSA